MLNYTQNFDRYPAADPDPFGNDGWRTCSPRSLRGHIVNGHFDAQTLLTTGVPLYDIEIAEVRDIGLGWVVKRAVEKIARPDSDIRTEIGSFMHNGNEVFGPVDERTYRVMLVKSIRLIEDIRMANIPWAKIDTIYEGASKVSLDLSRDTNDISFKASMSFLNEDVSHLSPVPHRSDFEVRI